MVRRACPASRQPTEIRPLSITGKVPYTTLPTASRPGMVWVRGDDLVLAWFLRAGRAAAVPRSRGAASPGRRAIAQERRGLDDRLDLPGALVLRPGLSHLRVLLARRAHGRRTRPGPRLRLA